MNETPQPHSERHVSGQVEHWAQAVLTALNVGDIKSGSPIHLKLREVMIAYREGQSEVEGVCKRIAWKTLRVEINPPAYDIQTPERCIDVDLEYRDAIAIVDAHNATLEHTSLAVNCLREALSLVEEYSCRTQVAQVCSDCEAVLLRGNAALSVILAQSVPQIPHESQAACVTSVSGEADSLPRSPVRDEGQGEE